MLASGAARRGYGSRHCLWRTDGGREGARDRRRRSPSCATTSAAGSSASSTSLRVDWPGRERRFDVVYHLLSPYKNQRIRDQGRGRRERDRAIADRRVPRRRLVRARDLRSLRHPVRRPSRHAAHPHRLRLRGASAAQGLPAHRLCRGALRRPAEARGLRQGAARAGIPQFRFPLAVGRARTIRCPATRRRSKNHDARPWRAVVSAAQCGSRQRQRTGRSTHAIAACAADGAQGRSLLSIAATR